MSKKKATPHGPSHYIKLTINGIDCGMYWYTPENPISIDLSGYAKGQLLAELMKDAFERLYNHDHDDKYQTKEDESNA